MVGEEPLGTGEEFMSEVRLVIIKFIITSTV